ncbi:THAP domain-containing protein 1-like [Culex quinquefasciatus]|uniref:THAP domain-containing protein 1-like n=1 Tax=Culex quinquefasciatus TaxID=7176 RepID=UPI0018E36D35|nr:THAP domain-containing protein 1-like [Culex quinquefasciatus]
MSKRCCAASCFNSNANSNRSLEYFGFPKSMEYATAWAKAASREDLLEKNLNNIVKYYLCSEHFTNDCFQDPPHNRKLKKTSRPTMVVPIPTIFRNNFDECVSKSLKEDKADVQLQEQLPEDSGGCSYLAGHQTELQDPLLLEEYIAFNQDHDQDSEILEEHFVQSSDDFESLAGKEEELVEEEDEECQFSEAEPSPNLCRLCLSNGDNELLVPIFGDGSEMAYILERILPDYPICPGDGFSQKVCLTCLEDATRCLNTIETFRAAQEKLKR